MNRILRTVSWHQLKLVGRQVAFLSSSYLKRRLKLYGKIILKWCGLELLDKQQTVQFLQPYLVTNVPAGRVVLPTVVDAAKQTKILFQEAVISVNSNHIWRIDKRNEQISLLRCGSLLIRGKLLVTDFTMDIFRDPFARSARQPVRVSVVIAPWSQYFEADSITKRYHRWITFQGYYDFMFLLTAKLCRIKETLPESVLAQAVVCYPLINQEYERDLLKLIGFRSDQIVDSRRIAVSFDTCFLGDSALESWRYPNPADVLSLKRQIEARVSFERTSYQRIYIRRAGRRRVLNEQDLMEMLMRYDFTIIEDVPRSIAEQVCIYKNASFILGPHGASFTNIIWCEPGTHLFELFNPDYVPDYFLYVAQLMGLRYSAYCLGSEVRNGYGSLKADITVSVAEVEACLCQLL